MFHFIWGTHIQYYFWSVFHFICEIRVRFRQVYDLILLAWGIHIFVVFFSGLYFYAGWLLWWWLMYIIFVIYFHTICFEAYVGRPISDLLCLMTLAYSKFFGFLTFACLLQIFICLVFHYLNFVSFTLYSFLDSSGSPHSGKVVV